MRGNSGCRSGGARRAFLGALAAPAGLALLVACTQPAEMGGDDDTTPDSLAIATGTSAGVYFPIGGAMAEIINDEVDGVTATVETTAASVENLRLIDQGASDLAIVQGDSAYQALHGEGEDFADDPIETRVLAVPYPNVYHAVSLASIHDDLDLDCFSDVAGHRFSVGAPGSGNELATGLVFDGLGMSFDDVDVQRLAYAETANALRQGQLDAGSWVVGESHGSLLELETTDPIHLIEMCEDERDAVADEHPFYVPHTIEGGTYGTVEDDVDTIALWNVVVVGPDFPEDLAHDIVEAIYANVDVVNRVYEPGEEYLVPDTLADSPIPLHPGAVAYAEDNGVDIPDELRP